MKTYVKVWIISTVVACSICILTSTAHEPETLAQTHVNAMREDGSTKHVVSILAASGEVCAQIGHNWRSGRPGEGPTIRFNDYHPGLIFRTCKVCKTCVSAKVPFCEMP